MKGTHRPAQTSNAAIKPSEGQASAGQKIGGQSANPQFFKHQEPVNGIVGKN
jgi:hypothetical protein